MVKKEGKPLIVSERSVKMWVEAREDERANCTYSGMSCCLLFISKSKIVIQEDAVKQKKRDATIFPHTKRCKPGTMKKVKKGKKGNKK